MSALTPHLKVLRALSTRFSAQAEKSRGAGRVDQNGWHDALIGNAFLLDDLALAFSDAANALEVEERELEAKLRRL